MLPSIQENQSVNIEWVDSELMIQSRVCPILFCHRQHLAAAVEEPFNVELEKAMLYEGMKNPLIGIENTEANWKEATFYLKSQCEFNPHADILIVYGNQRLRILDKYEREYPIPVVMAGSHIEAIVLNRKLNEPFLSRS